MGRRLRRPFFNTTPQSPISDSSPQEEPLYLPVRRSAGYIIYVQSLFTLHKHTPSVRDGASTSLFQPSLSRLSTTAPLYGSLFSPLLEERWHAVAEWWLYPSSIISRPPPATHIIRTGDHRSPATRIIRTGRRPTSLFQPPLSRLCRQLPSRGASLPRFEEWWLYPNVSSYGRSLVALHTHHSYGTAPPTSLFQPPLSRLRQSSSKTA